MGKEANVFLIIGAVVALGGLFPIAALAIDGGESEEPGKQPGEDRWVPSLAIISGITIQEQDGLADSVLFEDMSPTPIPLQGFVDGSALRASRSAGDPRETRRGPLGGARRAIGGMSAETTCATEPA